MKTRFEFFVIDLFRIMCNAYTELAGMTYISILIR